MKPSILLLYTIAVCGFGAYAMPQVNTNDLSLHRMEKRSKKVASKTDKKKTTTTTTKKTSSKSKKTAKSDSKTKADSSKKTSKSESKSKSETASVSVKTAPTIQQCKAHSVSLTTGTKVVPYYDYKSSEAGKYDIVDLSGGSAGTYYSLSSQGIEMKLYKPVKGATLGRGMTFNTTFEFEYGTVSFEMKAPGVGGTVTAGIILAPGGDEVDVEITGLDKTAFETNIYLGGNPVFNVFSGKSAVSSSTTAWHTYAIKRTPTYIQWSVDGKVTRTLSNGPNSMYKGVNHYPYHPGYLQFGLWDASAPAGTAKWAGGPIKWSSIKTPFLSAYVRNLKVTC